MTTPDDQIKITESGLKYIVEVGYHHERGAYDSRDAETTVDYEYVLELDKNGSIIGGKWLSYDRPDFLYGQRRIVLWAHTPQSRWA